MQLKRALLAAVAAGALVTGAIAATAPAAAKTFKWAFQGDVQSLDPHALFETFSLGFWGNIYESLVTYDGDMNLIGALAESYDNPEPTKWVFHLRKGVKFHNGNPFTADDVIFSWQRALWSRSRLYRSSASSCRPLHSIPCSTHMPEASRPAS